jgi:hypothetical protein
VTKPTLVITHAEGFLACFTQDDNGTMKQRALLDVGDNVPTAAELAKMGSAFADQFHWLNGAQSDAPPIRALPAKQKAHATKRSRAYQTTDATEVARIRADVILWLASHPDSVAMEIAKGVGIPTDDNKAMHRFYWYLRTMLLANQIKVTKQQTVPGIGGPRNHYRIAKP